MHQVEGLVDTRQRHLVRNQVVDIDAPFHIPVDDLRYIAPAACAAKGRALPRSSRHELKRPRRNFLAGSSHADYHAGAPSALATLERLPHQLDVADAFEGEIGATARQV